MMIPLDMCQDMITPDYELHPTIETTKTTVRRTTACSQAVSMLGDPFNVSVVVLHRQLYSK